MGSLPLACDFRACHFIVQTLLIVGLLVHRRHRALAEQGLKESEKRLRLITNSLPALIAYIDSNQRYRFNNDAYVAWFGVQPDGALGRTVREVVGEAPTSAFSHTSKRRFRANA